MNARVILAFLTSCAMAIAFGLSRAEGQIEPQPTPEPAYASVSLATYPDPFEMEILEVAPPEQALPEGDMTVKYWGDGDAIGHLQDIAWSIDIDDPAHTSLPLGIAPLSDQTVPTMSLGAVAIMMSTNGAVVLLGDETGLLGIRTGGYVSSPIQEQIFEFQLVSVGMLGCSICTEDSGEGGICSCSCNASGAQARCYRIDNHQVECRDAEGTIRCNDQPTCVCGPPV